MLLRLKTKVKLETTSHLIFFLIEFFKKKVLIIFLWKPDHFPQAPLSFSDIHGIIFAYNGDPLPTLTESA